MSKLLYHHISCAAMKKEFRNKPKNGTFALTVRLKNSKIT